MAFLYAIPRKNVACNLTSYPNSVGLEGWKRSPFYADLVISFNSYQKKYLFETNPHAGRRLQIWTSHELLRKWFCNLTPLPSKGGRG